MPMFDAGDVVETLDWDFTKAGVKAKGTIPEPSDAAIGRFLDALKNLYAEAQKDLGTELPEGASAEDMLEALSAVTGDAFVKVMADTAQIFAELCGSRPSTEQLLGLPLRVRVKFYGWVQREVVSPEAEPAAGIAAVRSLNSAAAG